MPSNTAIAPNYIGRKSLQSVWTCKNQYVRSARLLDCSIHLTRVVRKNANRHGAYYILHVHALCQDYSSQYRYLILRFTHLLTLLHAPTYCMSYVKRKAGFICVSIFICSHTLRRLYLAVYIIHMHVHTSTSFAARRPI